MERESLQDFQRNAGFVVIVIVGGFALLVYLSTSLSNVLVPLVWAAFFAVPLTALIARIDRTLTTCVVSTRQRVFGSPDKPVNFEAQADPTNHRYHIVVEGASAKTLLQKLEHPCRWLCWCKACRFLMCCQNRVRITYLETADDEPEVDRLVKDWFYYVKEPESSPEDITDSASVNLELYLDQECTLYPAALADSHKNRGKVKGQLEIDRGSIFSWCCAVLIALILMAFAVYIFFLLLSLGFDALSAHSKSYGRGIDELMRSLSAFLNRCFPHYDAEKTEKQIKDFARNELPSLASQATSKIESIGFDLLLFALYTLFWVCEPIPIHSQVAKVIKNYLFLKTFVCMVFAVLMGALLYVLSCPIWHLFFVLAFILNYIPEFGFMVVFALAIPAIALNADISGHQRERNTIILVIGSLLIKCLTGNILEVQMYISRGGKYMRMHPVVLLALMMLFERLFGASGMFLAIPIVAAVKYYVLSASVPDIYLNPSLVILEGDNEAPHKNFVDKDQIKKSYGSAESSYATLEPTFTSESA